MRTKFLLLILLRQRKLDDEDKKYDFNAWDDVELPIDHIQKVHEKLKQDELSLQDTECTDLHDHWNSFYKKNNKNFFKDRKWVVKEFPLLDCENKTIIELGCGVGNSLKHINKNNLLIGLDFSETAIRMLDHEAIEPKYHEKIFKNLYDVTKKGGKVFFRDYGYMDMVQLRYKNEQCIGENFYRRSDGTLTYFFKTDKLKQIAENAGFVVESLFEDKRMLTNRKKKIEMYRVMIQGVFAKV